MTNEVEQEAQPCRRRAQGLPDALQERYGSEEITGLAIEAGASEMVTIEAVPSRATAAGRYPVFSRYPGTARQVKRNSAWR